MDIYIAKQNMDKLLQYVEEVADAKPRMYQKSKDRWRDIANTCHQVLKTISEILQDEILETDSDVSHTSDNREVADIIAQVETELHQLKQFISYSPSPPGEQIKLDSNKSKLSTSARKVTMAKYREVLSNMVNKPSNNMYIFDIVNSLSKWFEIRFFQSYKFDSEFRYNIRRIPGWIYNIVIAYSKHIQSGTQDEFIHNFNKWCDDLLSPESHCKFAVPYEVFQIDKDDDKNSLSLTAVVLWDMLVDSGLHELCISDENELYLTDTAIYDMCVTYNPTLLDNYVNYQLDSNVLELCGLSKLSRIGGAD